MLSEKDSSGSVLGRKGGGGGFPGRGYTGHIFLPKSACGNCKWADI